MKDVMETVKRFEELLDNEMDQEKREQYRHILKQATEKIEERIESVGLESTV